MKTFLLMGHTHPSFKVAEEEVRASGVEPVSSDNLNMAYMHILFHFGDVSEIRNFLDQEYGEIESALAIEVSQNDFKKGSHQTYSDHNGVKQTLIRYLEEDDIFDVKECQFFNIK